MAEFQFYIMTKLVSTHIRKFKVEAEDESKARLLANQQHMDGGLGECVSGPRCIPGELIRILKDTER